MGLGTMLIRADGSPEIGTGHVMRCLALAQAWQDAGGKAIFAMVESTSAIRGRLEAEACAAVTMLAEVGSLDDALCTRDLAQRVGADWVVLDGYRFGPSYGEQICAGNWKVLFVDDCGANERYDADVILNQNLTASGSWYSQRRPDTQLLLGTRYSMLRREFAEWRAWKRQIRRSPKNVLLTLGGSTPEDLAACVLAALASVGGITTFFVIGGSSSNVTRLQRLGNGSPGNIKLLTNVTDMPQLMAECDIAVSASGSVCWELCFMGLPSLLVDLAANQTPVAEQLHSRGYAIHVGDGPTLDPEKLAIAIAGLLESHEERTALAQRGRQLVDGRGSERVVAALGAAVSNLASAL